MLWGMPLDLAVGLIGLVGALVGAFVGGWVTWKAAERGNREQIRLNRHDKLDTAVVELWQDVLAIAHSAREGAVAKTETDRILRALELLVIRSRPVAPQLSRALEHARMQYVDAVVSLRLRIETASESPNVSEALWDLEEATLTTHRLLGEWIRDPEGFESEPPTWGDVKIEVWRD